MRDETVEIPSRTGVVLRMHLEPGVDPRADEPAPHRPLMVRRVARTQIAEILCFVIGIAGRERSQADRRQKSRLHDVDDALPSRAIEHRIVERDRDDLIRTTLGAVAMLAVDDVE